MDTTFPPGSIWFELTGTPPEEPPAELASYLESCPFSSLVCRVEFSLGHAAGGEECLLWNMLFFAPLYWPGVEKTDYFVDHEQTRLVYCELHRSSAGRWSLGKTMTTSQVKAAKLARVLLRSWLRHLNAT